MLQTWWRPSLSRTWAGPQLVRCISAFSKAPPQKYLVGRFPAVHLQHTLPKVACRMVFIDAPTAGWTDSAIPASDSGTRDAEPPRPGRPRPPPPQTQLSLPLLPSHLPPEVAFLFPPHPSTGLAPVCLRLASPHRPTPRGPCPSVSVRVRPCGCSLHPRPSPILGLAPVWRLLRPSPTPHCRPSVSF